MKNIYNTQITICDMDNTLCFPSPYCDNAFLALALEDQHKLAQTTEFQEKCSNAPLAKWVAEDSFDFFHNSYNILVTARWFYMKHITESWLVQRSFYFDHIQFLNFHTFESCRIEKATFIERVINNFPVEIPVGMIYIIIDDDKEVLDRILHDKSYRKGAILNTYWINEGKCIWY